MEISKFFNQNVLFLLVTNFIIKSRIVKILPPWAPFEHNSEQIWKISFIARFIATSEFAYLWSLNYVNSDWPLEDISHIELMFVCSMTIHILTSLDTQAHTNIWMTWYLREKLKAIVGLCFRNKQTHDMASSVMDGCHEIVGAITCDEVGTGMFVWLCSVRQTSNVQQ